MFGITTTEEDERTVIENYDEVTHAAVRHTWLQPDGNTQRVEVENPRVLDGNNKPEYLRIQLPRKGMNFNVIKDLAEFDLQVTDVWQHDVDAENDVVAIKVEPRE